VHHLVRGGVRDVTLIGQNVNSYGLKRAGERTFAGLLDAVAGVPGLVRLRYTTSHPRDMGDDVVDVYRRTSVLASHLHLPVQSGSNRILKRMKRFYTRERYLSVVAALRDARPDLVLTTDVIVGFPSESEDDFDATMDLVEQAGIVGAFSFTYSPRPGTPALRLGDEVDRDVASRRLQRLQDRIRARSLAWHRSLEGQTVRVLIEGPSRHDDGLVMGRTSGFTPVNLPGGPDDVGRELDVRITRGFTNSCRGERRA
jgi:tRNA-2-methylthio-N6-dimethylallyladenosine synthase